MRWLPSISFSSSSSTADEPFSPTKRSSRRHNYLRGVALHFGNNGGGGGNGPRLTRQRRLRHLTDNDLSGPANAKSTSDSVDSITLSRSPSNSTSTAQNSRLSTSVPVPLPLPLPLPDNSNSADGEARLPSPLARDVLKERIDASVEGVSSSSTYPTSIFAGKEIKKTIENVETRPYRVVPPDVSNAERTWDKFRLNVPTRSAPTSPFSSPVLSPQTTSNVTDVLPYYHMIAKGGNQVWSAPEMATLDMPWLPPPAFFDISAFSSDTSPLHSPPNISPRLNPRSPSVKSSAKMSFESSTTRRDTTANIEVHPLPLPPWAPVASSSAPVPQGMPKLDSTPMQSQWQKGKLIGRGTFGSVYVASNRETGALCAMKEVELFPDDPKSAESIKQLEQEIKVLSQLKHPNIVQYYGSEFVDDHFYIYLEYVHPGSINKYAREHCRAITESVVRSFTRHILSGLAYLHSMKTIHRDIKGANLLVDAFGVVKLADFGMAKHYLQTFCTKIPIGVTADPSLNQFFLELTGQSADLSLKGSPYWMAPELLQAVIKKDNSSDLALAVDIWSLGCTIIEMINGKPPWSEYEGAAALFKVLKDTPPIPDTLSPEGKDFLHCCFRRNPAERPSASMLLEHRWLKNAQQLDVQSSTLSINGTKDMAYSPRKSEVKLDQFPLFPSSQNAKGKVVSESSSFTNYSFSSARLANNLNMKLPT